MLHPINSGIRVGTQYVLTLPGYRATGLLEAGCIPRIGRWHHQWMKPDWGSEVEEVLRVDEVGGHVFVPTRPAVVIPRGHKKLAHPTWP